jgi:manganese efflux pump family protein
MGIAALVTWLITALGGFYMLFTWISRGGPRQPSTSRFPPALIFGHFALAAIGLVLWIIYLIIDSDALAWIAFVLLVPVALLGFTMLARWLPTYRARTATVGAGEAGTATAATADVPAERHFPVAVVAGHGLFAVVTVVLVLLAALEV